MIKAVPRAQKDIPLEGIESVLLANECIVCKAFAFLETRGLSEKGVVCVTNLHILLISKQQTPLRSSRGLNSSASIFERIPLGVIDTLTERKTTHTASPNGPAAPTNPSLRVVCKDGRICDFLLGSNEDAERLYHHIYTFAFPGSISKLFAFYNRPNKSARKIVDFYPEQQESDDEDDDPLPPPPPPPATLPLDRGSSEDLSSTTGMTDTEDGDWDEDEFDTDFMMYDGWDVYHPKREFLRLGVRVNGREKRKKLPRYLRDQLKQDSSNLVNSPIYRSQWRLSKVNRSYQLSETYPRYLAVPRLITDQELLNSRNLRNLNRIPTLCYLHPETYAAICRASQLFVGLHGPRNPNDEKFLALVRSCGLNPNASVFILDCRPEKNTRGGRGCENLRYYQYCEYEYLGVRSLKKLKNKIESVWSLARICQEEVATHHQRNEKITVAIIDALRDPRAIEWVLTLKQIIRASRRIVQLVQQGSSVIVHCPQGRDRSPLAISLAMLQLDPFHRTIEGFEILVEKEWSSAGHQFQTRCGHGIENPGRDPDRVPLFVIFLDCVWQLLRQHPDSFEFNEEVRTTPWTFATSTDTDFSFFYFLQRVYIVVVLVRSCMIAKRNERSPMSLERLVRCGRSRIVTHAF